MEMTKKQMKTLKNDATTKQRNDERMSQKI